MDNFFIMLLSFFGILMFLLVCSLSIFKNNLLVFLFKSDKWLNKNEFFYGM